MSTYSEVEICNIALHAIGSQAIESFDDDKKAARACSSFYGFSRDYLLACFDWNFARRYKTLAVGVGPSDDVAKGYCVYQLPDDCLIVRKMMPYQQRDRWEVVGDRLWATRSEDVSIFYTAKEYNTHLFSNAFANTLALNIAVRLAPIMAQDEKLAKAMFEQAMIEQREAFAISANESNNYREYDETPENDTFVNPDIACSFPTWTEDCVYTEPTPPTTPPPTEGSAYSSGYTTGYN